MMDDLARVIARAWADNGEVPFPLYEREANLIATAVRSYLLSEERVEAAARAVERESVYIGDRATVYARAALTAAIGRVTYAEQLSEAHEEWGKQVERAVEAERKLDAVRAALAPVMDWYDGEPADGDEHEPRDLVDILTDVVSDLQADRASSLRMVGALRPFAAMADALHGEIDDAYPCFGQSTDKGSVMLRARDFRAAREAVDVDFADVGVTKADVEALDAIFIMSLRRAGKERDDELILNILANHRCGRRPITESRKERADG